MTREQAKILLVLVPVEVGCPMMTFVHEREEAKASNCIILFLSMHLRVKNRSLQILLPPDSFLEQFFKGDVAFCLVTFV